MTKQGIIILSALCSLALPGPAFAGKILIVNGSSGTSEPNTTSSITNQISTQHVAAGNTVTVNDTVPDVLTDYSQIWDLRFSNVFALSAPVQSQYLSFLQGGGGMFVMGENSFFPGRNQSILSLISLAGGGNLNFATPGDNQVVYAPFTGPNPLSSITYSAAGGVDGFGTGQWITSNIAGTAGSGVAFGVGSLSNATAGALTTIFDVNFLQTDANLASQSLTRNLVKFVGDQVEPPIGSVPETSTWAMFILGFGAIGYAIRRRIAASDKRFTNKVRAIAPV